MCQCSGQYNVGVLVARTEPFAVGRPRCCDGGQLHVAARIRKELQELDRKTEKKTEKNRIAENVNTEERKKGRTKILQ